MVQELTLLPRLGLFLMMYVHQESRYRGLWELRGAKFESIRQERKEWTSSALECLPKAGYPL